MNVFLRDPSSNKGQSVTEHGRGLVQSHTMPMQAHQAAVLGQHYHVVGETTPNANTEVVLHLKNTATDGRVMLIDYVKMQLIGSAGTATPDVASYFTHTLYETFASGGTAEILVNTNPASSNVAAVTAYDNNPTLAGTAVQADKLYCPTNGGVVLWESSEALVVPPLKNIAFKCTTDHTTATAICMVAFSMVLPEYLE